MYLRGPTSKGRGGQDGKGRGKEGIGGEEKEKEGKTGEGKGREGRETNGGEGPPAPPQFNRMYPFWYTDIGPNLIRSSLSETKLATCRRLKSVCDKL